jgi:hypothetical protein
MSSMNAAEFKVLFDSATTDWDEQTKEECREMIRADWKSGDGYPRDVAMGGRDERRAGWITWFQNRIGGSKNYGVNERVRAAIEAKRREEENNRAGAQVDV